MNYAAESSFLRRHRQLAALAAVGYAAANVVVGVVWPSGWQSRAVAALLVAATCYAFWYLPLYLRLSVETQKRYRWAVRARLVAVPLVALAAAPYGASRLAWLTWAGAVALGAVVALAARGYLSRYRELDEHPVLPLQFLAGDAAVVLLVAASGFSGGTAPHAATIAALGLALALYTLVAKRRGYAAGLGVAVASIAGLVWLWSPAGASALEIARLALRVAVLPLAAYGATATLVARAAAHHATSVGETVENLAAFALVTPEHARDLLATATAALAESWNASPPAGPSAVARWYEENSELYLYDLAQFHLAYKHIAFMLDICDLARGRVLDYGAGIGDLALELARRGHETVYLDVDGRTKAFAQWRAEREWLPVEFARELEEVEPGFETIVSLDVFEHLAEPEPVVDALVDALAPGGRMIVTAAFGPTKAHPMHFDHDLDLAAFLRSRGLCDAKSFAMRHLRSELLAKRNVLVYEKPSPTNG